MEFELDLIDLDFPRTNEIYRYGLPWKQFGYSQRKVTIISITLFV